VEVWSSPGDRGLPPEKCFCSCGMGSVFLINESSEDWSMEERDSKWVGLAFLLSIWQVSFLLGVLHPAGWNRLSIQMARAGGCVGRRIFAGSGGAFWPADASRSQMERFPFYFCKVEPRMPQVSNE